MSLEYIRKTYKVPAKRGGRVRFKFGGKWRFGRITSATHCIKVAPDEYPNNRLIFHPSDLDYLENLPS